jgi:hypothetical protein
MHDELNDSAATPATTAIQAEQLLDGTQRKQRKFPLLRLASFSDAPARQRHRANQAVDKFPIDWVSFEQGRV